MCFLIGITLHTRGLVPGTFPVEIIAEIFIVKKFIINKKMSTQRQLIKYIKSHANPEKAQILSKFFKT
ncbi:MAG: hypothetical protein ACOZBL_04180 [Patescibacteria group bacterium]